MKISSHSPTSNSPRNNNISTTSSLNPEHQYIHRVGEEEYFHEEVDFSMSGWKEEMTQEKMRQSSLK